VIFGTASLVGERLSRIFVSIDITEVAQSHGEGDQKQAWQCSRL